MNGLLGFTIKPNQNITQLAAEVLKYFPAPIYKLAEDSFISSIYNNNSIPLENSFFTNKSRSVFFIGNCFNLSEIQDHIASSSKYLPQLIYEFYNSQKLDELLGIINGVFSIVIIDQKRKNIKIISDRFGLQPLFYYAQGSNFVWCSQIKGIINLPFVTSNLSHKSINCFVEIGHLLGDHTYFKDIKQLPPSSIVTYNYHDNDFSIKTYWSWSNISPIQISFDEAVQETGRLFIQAVERQFVPDNNTGVSLSGGLDSRLILAAIHKLYPNYRGFAYTFGQKGCLDLIIAKQVAQVTNWEHQFYLIDEHNWYDKRLESILQTEGMKSIINLHGCEHIDSINKKIKINLNGYLGGAILGGRSMNYYDRSIKKIDKNLAKQIYGSFADLTTPEHSFYNISHPDIFVMNNRGRRFINLGPLALSPYIQQRRPYMDNDLVSFLFSLPSEFRQEHRLFKAVALDLFNPFFQNIPWQQTGFPIKKNLNSFTKMKRLIFRKSKQINPFYPALHYSNYQDWMKTSEMKKRLEEVILGENTSLLQCFKQNELDAYMTKYERNDKDSILKIARLFTLNHYLTAMKNRNSI